MDQEGQGDIGAINQALPEFRGHLEGDHPDQAPDQIAQALPVAHELGGDQGGFSRLVGKPGSPGRDLHRDTRPVAGEMVGWAPDGSCPGGGHTRSPGRPAGWPLAGQTSGQAASTQYPQVPRYPEA